MSLVNVQMLALKCHNAVMVNLNATMVVVYARHKFAIQSPIVLTVQMKTQHFVELQHTFVPRRHSSAAVCISHVAQKCC